MLSVYCKRIGGWNRPEGGSNGLAFQPERARNAAARKRSNPAIDSARHSRSFLRWRGPQSADLRLRGGEERAPGAIAHARDCTLRIKYPNPSQTRRAPG